MFSVDQPPLLRRAMYWLAAGAPWAPAPKEEAELKVTASPCAAACRTSPPELLTEALDLAAVFFRRGDHLPAAAVGQQGAAAEALGGEGVHGAEFRRAGDGAVAIGGFGARPPSDCWTDWKAEPAPRIGSAPGGALAAPAKPSLPGFEVRLVGGFGEVVEVVGGGGAVGVDFGVQAG